LTDCTTSSWSSSRRIAWRQIEREGRLSEASAIGFIAQACRAMQYAHKVGLIHRDIKPTTSSLRRTPGQTDRPGLSKKLDTNINLTHAAAGWARRTTWPGAVPRCQNAGARCDVYSLGATLYHL